MQSLWDALNYCDLHDIVKINVYGAFSDASQGSYGVVIRDEQGQVLLSAWGIIDNASSAEQVELVGCNEGVKLAARWVPRPAILESDCLTAMNLILKPNSQRSPWAFIVRELAAVAIELPSISFKHVKREQNSVAHELAQLAQDCNPSLSN
jgi:ribonuclease HI